MAGLLADAAPAAAREPQEEAGGRDDGIDQQLGRVVLDPRGVTAHRPRSTQAALLAQERLGLLRERCAHRLTDMAMVLAAKDERVRAQLDRLHAGANRQ